MNVEESHKAYCDILARKEKRKKENRSRQNPQKIDNTLRQSVISSQTAQQSVFTKRVTPESRVASYASIKIAGLI